MPKHVGIQALARSCAVKGMSSEESHLRSLRRHHTSSQKISYTRLNMLLSVNHMFFLKGGKICNFGFTKDCTPWVELANVYRP